MSINNGDVERRYSDLSEVMLAERPELIVVQEVSIDVGQSSLRGLAASLGADYSFHYEAVYPGQEDEQGMGIVTALDVISSASTCLTQGGNQAQIVELGSRYQPLGLANVHLEAPPQKELLRMKKMAELSQEMRERHGNGQQMVAGDFNALPLYPVIRMMKSRFGYVSAYAAMHGAEPDFTYPTLGSRELLDGSYLKPEEVEQFKKIARIGRFLRRYEYELPRFTADYLFIKNMGRPLAATLLLGKDSGSKPISDHAGLRVTTA